MSDNRLFTYLALGCLLNAGWCTHVLWSIHALWNGRTDVDTLITIISGIIIVPFGGILGILRWI